ncbi:MAG: enoyl-CoA hydratase/isomerase family protein [Deltaproteobacteria bacterium]|nr:enoyl-CoA hydratase/isomerase family protein [Deltaproteobacteria bacterium]
MVILTIRRPPANALDNATVMALRRAMEDLMRRGDDVKGIVLTGHGDRFFSAGGDVKELEGLTVRGGVARIRAFHAVIGLMERIEAPVVCAVNGYAVGGGAELCLFSDHRVAVRSARFGLPEVNHGLLPAAKSIRQAVRVLGLRDARRLLYGGDIIDAEEARRIGVVDDIVENREELMRKAIFWVRTVGSKPRALTGPLKWTMLHTAGSTDKELERMTVQDFRRYFGTPEVRERMRSVLGRWKRPRNGPGCRGDSDTGS